MKGLDNYDFFPLVYPLTFLTVKMESFYYKNISGIFSLG